MGHIKDLNSILGRLTEYDSLHYSAKGKERDRIEQSVRTYADTWVDELYLDLNNNAASGLFSGRSFDRDMNDSIVSLRRMIEEGKSYD